ncbi:MAG: restriction endonuclease subunit S [Acidovorax sp.]|uniref:restriction endonuclease subunit S n=1 Tax=Acidovorax sp. TaxID=1872122 RepID=UPI00391B626F
MSSEWPQSTLGEFVRLQRGHDLTASEQQAGSIPIMGSAGPNGTHSEALAHGSGVVIGRSGASAGRVHFSEVDYWPHNTCLYVTDFLGNNPRFAYYLLQTLDLAAFNSGSAQPSLNRNYLYSISLKIPPRAAQDGIVDVLKSLDDRITLLRETNATLEAIAQALFKSWFVDFDPVRAKMEGRVPEGMDEATAALFPDALEESELGWVPKGWRMSHLADLTSTHHGSIQTGPFGSQLHASDYVDSGVPVVMPKDIKDRRVMTDSVARVSQENADRLSRHKLISGDIVFSRRGDVERHALITQREAGWLCGTGCLLLRPGKSWRSSTFLSMALDASQARTWLVQHAVGATMPNINTGILGSVPVLLPPDALLSAFEDVVSATELQRSHNSSTAETLSTLRDTLLPRLISGQLRLPNAMAAMHMEAA